ncbi:MAG: CvpA family protein [Eubacteriales bacterium]|nr:CvpA family protein [Eubacteriales bacterium]
MSWILITTIGVFILCALDGWRKGIIRIVVSIAALLISIVATAFLSPVIANTIKKNTSVYDYLCENMYQAVCDNEKLNAAIDETVTGEAELQFDKNNMQEYEDRIGGYVEKINNIVNLPDGWGNAVMEGFYGDYLSVLTQGENTIKDIVVKAFAYRLADIILKAVVYIGVFVIICVVLRVLSIATGIVSRLPVIHQANKLLGMAAGLVEGLLIIWVIYLILTAMSGNAHIAQALSDIEGNIFLKQIYDNNMIMKMLFH